MCAEKLKNSVNAASNQYFPLALRVSWRRESNSVAVKQKKIWIYRIKLFCHQNFIRCNSSIDTCLTCLTCLSDCSSALCDTAVLFQFSQVTDAMALVYIERYWKKLQYGDAAMPGKDTATGWCHLFVRSNRKWWHHVFNALFLFRRARSRMIYWNSMVSLHRIECALNLPEFHAIPATKRAVNGCHILSLSKIAPTPPSSGWPSGVRETWDRYVRYVMPSPWSKLRSSHDSC